MGWKTGDLAALKASLAFPFRVGSTSIFRLRRESSCCIFAWPSRMAAKSRVMPAGTEGPSSPYPCSPLSPQLASSWLVHVGLDLGGVTCRRDHKAQVSQSSQKVKSVINGVMNAYL